MILGDRWWRSSGTLGIGADTFRDVRVGCLGAVLLVLFTAGSVFGLVAMAWWFVLKNSTATP
jgi:hypothetical protein